MHAEGVVKRAHGVGKRGSIPQFTKEDLVQLIRQCPLNTRASAYSFPWLLENVGRSLNVLLLVSLSMSLSVNIPHAY